MVANADPVSAGVFEANFERVFSSRVEKTEIEAVFHPRLNSVSLEFRHGLTNYRQFWDEAARLNFAAALELYKADYAEKNFDLRFRRSRAIYGRVKGRIEWQSFRFSRTYVANPTIELGYRFRGEYPYFTTTMRSIREEGSQNDRSARESGHINMYFTIEQADELVKIFNQEHLMGLLEVNGRVNAHINDDINANVNYDEPSEEFDREQD